MKKLLFILLLLCAPAFAGNTIDIGGLPTPMNGVITLQPGDILPANRTGVTYQLQYPSSIVASSAPAGTLTGTTLAANVVNSSLTSAAGGAFGTGAYATAYVLPTATTSVLGGVKIDGTTITIGTTGIISAASAPIAIGTTGITGGTSGKLLYDNSAVFGETSALPNGTTATTQSAGDNSTKVATTAYINQNGFGYTGLRNRIINGSMRIDQRNAGASQTISTTAYTVDRFYASATGASVTGQQVAGSGADQNEYKFTGAASVTAIAFGQRIEAANIYDLNSTTATLSVKLSNSLLTTVTWTAYYPTATDNWASRTQIATGTFTVTSTPTVYSAQIALGANVTAGLEIELTVGAQTSGTWTITEFQLENGSVATPFERRPLGLELALCQRYYQIATLWASGFVPSAGQGVQQGFSLPVTMRAVPTATLGTPIYNDASTGLVSNVWVGGGTVGCIVSSASFGSVNTFGSTFSAEL